MTVKTNDLPTNNLNINEIENITPPNSLELGLGKEGESNNIPVNTYIIKLVSRLLEMADEDYSVLTPIDRETLRDVLACGSIDKVAKKQHKSQQAIRERVNKAIDTIVRQVRVWQDPHRKLVSLNKRVLDLEKNLESQKNLLASQTMRCAKLEKENFELKEKIKNHEFDNPQDPFATGLTLVDDQTKRLLKSDLEEIHIPSLLVSKLHAHNIRKVYDLVRYKEKDLARLDGIGFSDLLKINRHLKPTGLSLGSDFRFIEALGEYYVKK